MPIAPRLLGFLALFPTQGLVAQAPPPAVVERLPAHGETPVMVASQHHLFVLRNGVLYQFDVHTLELRRTHTFDDATKAAAAVAAATTTVAPPTDLPPPPSAEALKAAYGRALHWLVAHQDEDGRWDSDGFGKHDPDGVTDGAGNSLHDVSATGLSMMALLGSGSTLRSGPHREALKKAAQWLVNQQDPQSGLFGPRAAHDYIYDHAIATFAMCEAYGLSGKEELREPAQKGLDYLEMHRNPYAVWRYQPRDNDNDTSVTTWALLAYESGDFFKLRVNKEALVCAATWYDQVTTPDGRAGYTKAGEPSSRLTGDHREKFPPEKGEAMTAAATFARYLLQQSPDKKPVMTASLQRMTNNPPRWQEGSIDAIYWYFGTSAAWQAGGEHWQTWSRTLGELAAHQRSDGPHDGSWDPIGVWDGIGGRVHVTALYALSLMTGARMAKRR